MKTPLRYANASWDHVPPRVKELVTKMFRENGKGIYLHGGVGSGKTHLAYGIRQQVHDCGMGMYLWNVTDLLREIKSDFGKSENRSQPVEEFNGEISRAVRRLLILDDIGAENPTDFVIETLYGIINERYNHLLPTIFTSNYTLGELADRIGERSASRIAEMCEIIELTGDDRRLKTR